MSRRPRTRIKICGLRSPEAAIAAVDAGADAVGFVRAPGSPRCIDDEALDEVIELIPPFVTRVGVFRNQPLDAIILPGKRGIDWVQLHGEEDEAFVEMLDVPVVRGISFSPETVRRWDAHPLVHALLVDGPEAGSGVAFDHAELAALATELDKPVILAGGLTPDNVGEAIRTVRPWAVDVSSGVESEPGVKEPELIRAFCDAVRAADEA